LWESVVERALGREVRRERGAVTTILPESPSINFVFQLGRCFMKRKKGDLPGRYVPRHVRKAPNRPYEYVNVSDWQEMVEPQPAPLESLPLQGELDLRFVARKNDANGDQRSNR
jgi:hypothetical protein